MSSIVFLAISQVFSKTQFNRYPDMGVHQYIMLRAAAQIFFQILVANFYFKKYIWDDLTARDFRQLSWRCLFGFFALTFQIVAVKNLPLVLIALVMNTMPLFTALFGFFLLGETLKILEKICLVISFAGVAVMITGSNLSFSTESNLYTYSVFTITALVLVPILLSLVTILLRTLKGCSAHA